MSYIKVVKKLWKINLCEGQYLKFLLTYSQFLLTQISY